MDYFVLIMKSFRKIWAFYSFTVFFLLLFVLFLFYLLAFLILPKKQRKYVFWFNHFLFAPFFLFVIGVRVKVIGKKFIDSNQTYIIVSNHVSVIDFLVNARAFPGIYKFLAKRELAKVPFFGFLVRKHCVLVDRSSTASRVASIKYLKQTLNEGYSVFLYPEGTRNRGNEPLLPFHKGAFRMAIESGNPIAVQTMLNVDNVAGKGDGFEFSPGTVVVKWSPPIPVSGLDIKDVDMLSEQVRACMLESLEKNS